ncbi:MAG TPA: hypothetical protein VKT72_18020 [Candidatus Baltobacteraceae bacterium]|nr:hypothetical protein [Candidatus Baltobacteraceae bacterium]
MNEQRTPAEQTRVEQGTIGQETRLQDADAGFLPEQRMSALRERWNDVQAGFVDDPQNAVQQAHGLVTELVDELVQTFSQERTTLENQWKSGVEADTETLRVALQRYRSFFNRLLGT